METITKTVAELDAPARAAMEQVVGHPLTEQHKLQIKVFSPVNTQIKSKLPDYCNVFEGLSDDEVDDICSAIVRSRSTRVID
jgi:hypothetical protein